MNDCIFCAIVTGESPSLRVTESESAIAFLDVNPASFGHSLVIPKRHADDIWDLSAEDGGATWSLVQETAARLRAKLNPDGMTLFQANRRAGWQDVYHFHVHVVPRWTNDGLIRPWESTPVDRTELERVAALLA
jgi:histidine triad (HIT) family protein